MKRNVLFSAALAGLMLASCASKDDLGSTSTTDKMGGNGYMSVTVNLPSRSANVSRAANDKYDDGVASEYAVNNGILALFDADSKNSEGEYTLLAAYNLDLTDKQDDLNNDNITTTQSVVTKIQSVTASNIYALVLLNNNSILTAEDGKLMNDKTDLTGKTYSDILKLTTVNPMNGSGFFMANAPLSATPGGSATTAPDGTYTTLAKVDPKCIKETREEAIASPAVSVYVERGVAKVTLKNGMGTTPQTTDGNLAFTFVGWALDNTTKSSYIVRNMGTDAGNYLKYSSEKFGTSYNYRFIGNTKLSDNKSPEVNLYRTYWCVDPTYSDNYTDATSHSQKFNTSTNINTWHDANYAAYCHENTFDVAHMNYQNSTRALVKATFNSGNDFYTCNGANTILDSDTKRNDAVMSYVLGTGVNIDDLKAWLTANQKDTPTTTWEAKDFELTWENNVDANGILKVKSIGMSSDGQSKLVQNPTDFSSGWNAIVEALNKNRVIRKYANGASYYEVRIKHFAGSTDADDLAPWNTWENPRPSATTAYPGNQAQNYLGRYGLVRNNWYEIEVTGIKKIGSPVVPDITTDTTPDDHIDAYISAKINVLSWAKRTQSTILQ